MIKKFLTQYFWQKKNSKLLFVFIICLFATACHHQKFKKNDYVLPYCMHNQLVKARHLRGHHDYYGRYVPNHWRDQHFVDDECIESFELPPLKTTKISE